jgi:hypothetical protein
MVVAASLAGCCQEAAEAAHDEPAIVEEVGDSELKRITLTAHAAERLDIQTAAVESASSDGRARLVVPYGAVVWDADGTTRTYTMPAEHVFIRAPITLDRIDGDRALLLEGPDPGTLVVTVGAAELWGTEHGVGGGGH